MHNNNSKIFTIIFILFMVLVLINLFEKNKSKKAMDDRIADDVAIEFRN